MKKCNFKNVSATIDRYISEAKRKNQVEFLYSLFNFFILSSPNFDFDNGRVCKWLNGSATVSPKIIKFYKTKKENAEHLAYDICNYIFPCLYDKEKMLQELYNLVVCDETISDKKRLMLIRNYNQSDFFVADVLIFSLERKFEKEIPQRKEVKRNE